MAEIFSTIGRSCKLGKRMLSQQECFLQVFPQSTGLAGLKPLILSSEIIIKYKYKIIDANKKGYKFDVIKDIG